MATKKSDQAPAAGAAGQKRRFSVQFDDAGVTFASQFLINATAEELIVGFSSGVMDSDDGLRAVLPVQNRIAMTRPAAARLVRLLAGALRRTDTQGTGTSS